MAKADDDTTGEGEEEVEVKEQYTLTVNHRYDTQDGEVFEKGTETLNEGDEWSATAKADVKHDGVNYIFDASLSTSPLNGTISGDVTVNWSMSRTSWGRMTVRTARPTTSSCSN